MCCKFIFDAVKFSLHLRSNKISYVRRSGNGILCGVLLNQWNIPLSQQIHYFVKLEHLSCGNMLVGMASTHYNDKILDESLKWLKTDNKG